MAVNQKIILTNFRLPPAILAKLDAYAKKEYLTRTRALIVLVNKSLPEPQEKKENTK